MTKIQEWCQPHWDALREAVEAKGLAHLVSQGGVAAAAMMADELKVGAARDAEGFDPLLRAWSMINGQALEQGSGLVGCPLCFVQRHHDECQQPTCDKPTPAEWIEGCTESLRTRAETLGLLRTIKDEP